MPLSKSADSLRILVIDDDEDALEMSRALVHKVDPDTTISLARGAREGMDFLLRATDPGYSTSRLPHLVFLDVNMPGLSGFEVLRWIRHNKSLATVKVVMLATSGVESEIKRAAELGAHGYLFKYPNPSCLAALLKQVAVATALESSKIAN